MGDSLSSSEFGKSGDRARNVSEKKLSRRCSDATIYKASLQPSVRHIASIRHGKCGSGMIGVIGLFVLKTAALETVRRFSKAKCPFVWRGLQALQVLSYPPFKWIQRFAPFKSLIKGVQMFSRPLLLLSIATAFTEEAESNDSRSNNTHESNPGSDVHSEGPPAQNTVETRVCDESPQSSASETWLIKLHRELDRQGIILPERINEDELHRFYTAANGDFSCFLSSIKKTIRWRETYRILSAEELEIWSNMVFWHGFDIKQRPCLVVRLGLACISLPLPDRPRFAQAVISQVEHGVLHLLDAENPEITVVVDCEGLSPFKVPMQVMRTCSSLLQDHFPNRLGCLFVIRLPPVLRVIAQTFIQILKPVTRKKLKVEGEMFRKVLSEYLQALPSYIDGQCTCEKCSEISNRRQFPSRTEIRRTESTDGIYERENLLLLNPTSGADLHGNCDQVVRTAMISVLMLWIFIALIAGILDPESRPFFSST